MKDCPQCHVLLDDAEASCPQCQHNFSTRPAAPVATCPHCGGALPSALAKLCPNCRTPLGMSSAPAGGRPAAPGGRPAAPGGRPSASTAPRAASYNGPQAPPQGSWMALYIGIGLIVAITIGSFILAAHTVHATMGNGDLTLGGAGPSMFGPNFHAQSDDLQFTNKQPVLQDGQWVIDGKVKNISHQPVTGLTVLYLYIINHELDISASNIQKVTVGDVPAGTEVPFHATFPTKGNGALGFFGTSNN